MPHSRHRHKAHPQHAAAGRKKPAGRRSASTILAVFIGLFGVAIAFFAVGSSPLWLATGGILGILAGLLLGKRMDKSAS